MPRDTRHLTRWEVTAVIVLAALALPAFMAFDWLHARYPRMALAVSVAANACVVVLIGFMACTAWRMVLISYRTRRDPADSSVGTHIRTLLREPWPLYFACLFTAGTFGAVVHLIRDAIRRAI